MAYFKGLMRWKTKASTVFLNDKCISRKIRLRGVSYLPPRKCLYSTTSQCHPRKLKSSRPSSSPATTRRFYFLNMAKVSKNLMWNCKQFHAAVSCRHAFKSGTVCIRKYETEYRAVIKFFVKHWNLTEIHSTVVNAFGDSNFHHWEIGGRV